MDALKILCYGIGCVFAVYILMLIFPYIVMGLALIGVWHLVEEYNKNNKRKF
jgi:hypothetical protein